MRVKQYSKCSDCGEKADASEGGVLYCAVCWFRRFAKDYRGPLARQNVHAIKNNHRHGPTTGQ